MNYKKCIVDSGIRLEQSGLTVETWGNISLREPETGLIYLTPSAMKYNTISESDVVVSQIDGTIVDGRRKPTIEMGMHLAVYRHRPSVNAIVHTHPIYSMVYAVQQKSIPLMIDEAAQALGDTCRCTAYALPGSEALARACVDALGDQANACLLHSHGAVCLGIDIDAAFKVATVLEVTARILYMVEATGGRPMGISAADVAAMKAFAQYHYGQDK